MKNQNLEYVTKLQSVKDIIAKLKKVEIDLPEEEVKVSEIESRTKEQIEETYREYEKYENKIFLEDLLNQTYSDAILELASLWQNISLKYENYYNLFLKFQTLETKLQEEDNLESCIKLAIDLLSELKNVSIHTDLALELTNNIYKLVYKIIKKEMKKKSTSQLLEIVKLNEVDSFWISALVEKDLQKASKSSNKKQLNLPELRTEKLLNIETITSLQKKEKGKTNQESSEDDWDKYLENKKSIREKKALIENLTKKMIDLKLERRKLLLEWRICLASMVIAFSAATYTGYGYYRSYKEYTEQLETNREMKQYDLEKERKKVKKDEFLIILFLSGALVASENIWGEERKKERKLAREKKEELQDAKARRIEAQAELEELKISLERKKENLFL